MGGRNLRNCIILGESINNVFFAKMIKIGEVWKENRREILEKQLVWGAHQ